MQLYGTIPQAPCFPSRGICAGQINTLKRLERNTRTYRVFHFECLSDILQGWAWYRGVSSHHCNEYNYGYHQGSVMKMATYSRRPPSRTGQAY